MGKLTNNLILVNVIIFIIVFSFPEELMNQVFSTFSYSGPQILQIWRWFTSLFLHASASHLFFNMIGLYYFGKTFEDKAKPKIWLAAYFLAGVIGNLVFGFTSPDPVVGASGCIFGLMGASMLIKPKEWVKVFVFPLPLGIVAVFYAIISTMLVFFSAGLAVDNIAHIAHLTGLLVGSLFAVYFFPKKAVKGIMWLIFFIVLLIALAPLFGIIFGLGNLILSFIDAIIGFFLYGISYLLSFLWAV